MDIIRLRYAKENFREKKTLKMKMVIVICKDFNTGIRNEL